MAHLPHHLTDEIVHKALASDIRKGILISIGKKPKYLSEIASELGKKPQTADFHISMLEEIGLIESEWKEGKKYYSIKDKKILEFIREGKPLPPGIGPKPPHEIVLDMWNDVKKRLDIIEKKIDKIEKK